MGTKDQGTVGTEDQKNSEHQGPDERDPEDQSNSGYRGPEEQREQRIRGKVGIKDQRNSE